METLREKLFGKSQPLREKLATIANTAAPIVAAGATAIKGLGTMSGKLGGKAVIATAAGALDEVFGKTDAEKEMENQKKIAQEAQAQIDANKRMGYESDEQGNPTTKIPGFVEQPPVEPDTLGTQFAKKITEGKKAIVAALNGDPINYTKAAEEEPVVTVEPEKPIAPKEPSKMDIVRKGILYNENRGAVEAGKNPYVSVGPTGDLGKYQTSPETLKGWSKVWLGREYTPEEFLADENAQEKYFNEFLKVVERLDLTPEEAAVTWHRGWGELGEGDKATRDERFRSRLQMLMKDEISRRYLDSFQRGVGLPDPQDNTGEGEGTPQDQ